MKTFIQRLHHVKQSRPRSINDLDPGLAFCRMIQSILEWILFTQFLWDPVDFGSWLEKLLLVPWGSWILLQENSLAQVGLPPFTGGVSYTVGGAAAPPTLCFATPTLVRFSGFLALKRWCLTLAMQYCHICRHFGIQDFVLYLSGLA